MFNFHESNVIIHTKKTLYSLLNGLNTVVRHSNICNLRQCEQGTKISPKKFREIFHESVKLERSEENSQQTQSLKGN